MEQKSPMSLRGESAEDDVFPIRSEVEAELSRILNSRQFRNAPVLQSFLRFITLRALETDGNDLNEYTIALEVFGRSSTFDSSVDTIVRTQAYRLRSKLNEFYRTEGAADSIAIEIPKGHYVPSFHVRPPGAVDPIQHQDPKIEARILETSPFILRPGQLVIAALLGMVAISCFLSGLLIGRRHSPALETRGQLSEVDSFWLNFLGADRQPVVAYTNSIFLASDSGDLLRFADGPVSGRGAVVSQDTASRGVGNRNVLKQSGTTYYEDDMTGVGEVAGAVAISHALYRIGARPVFKRSRSISASDLANHNVIFLGSPFVNQILNDLPTKPSFLFIMQRGRSSLWGGMIVNANPRPAELARYTIERAPGTQILRTDYGVVSELPGLTSGRKLIVLAGLTTTGTQAAAEFVTSVEGIRKMSEHVLNHRWPTAFDYLLRVRLNQGVDIVAAECVAVRP